MIKEIAKKFIYNDMVFDISEFDTIYRAQDPLIYEDIRVIDRIPIFLGDHCQNLINTAKSYGHDLNLPKNYLKEMLTKLGTVNDLYKYDVRIILNHLDESKQKPYFFIINTSYPEQSTLSEGIKTLTSKSSKAELNEIYNNPNMSEEIYKNLNENGIYEILLVNNKGSLKEGLNSSVFFIKNGKVLVPYSNNEVQDIPRMKIKSICSQYGIEINEQDIEVNNINSYDAAFLTSISFTILPIQSIDTILFNPQEKTLTRLVDICNNEIEEYLRLESKLNLYSNLVKAKKRW